MTFVTRKSLCENCQNFQIERLFGDTGPNDNEITDNSDSPYHNNLVPGGCELCDFFMECVPERCKVRSTHGTWSICVNSTCAPGTRVAGKVGVWCYPPKTREMSLGSLWMVIGADEGSIGSKAIEVSPFVCIDNARLPTCELQALYSRVDLAPISEWLKTEADTNPGRWNSGEPSASLVLTVIDCSTRRLVPLDNQERYATLSYVWGPSVQPSLDETDGIRLPLHLPDTIQDSIHVCNELNIRYLWVDRYCIPQESGHLRNMQIRRMDEVYQNSFLTIVACAGRDPYVGLPGVSRQRTSNPSIEIVGLGCLQGLSQSVEIHSDVWATRAWTYQEALLSQRQLYFTDRGTFFASVHGPQKESKSASEARLEQFLPAHLRTESSSAMTVRDSNNRIYSIGRLHVWECISEYSTRTLSYQSDLLIALLGILAYYRREHDICHLWGIPFSAFALVSPPHSFISFEMSLRWIAIGNSPRREGFPSWSWTGCNGCVKHLDVNRGITYNTVTNKEEAVHIEIELASGRLLKWSDYLANYANLQEYSETQPPEGNTNQPSRFIHFDALTSRIVRRHRGQAGIHYYSIDASSVVSGELELFGAVEIPSDTESNVETEESFPVGSLLALHFPQLDSSSLGGGVYDPPRYSFWNDGCALLIRNFGDHWERVCLLGSRRGLKREEVHKVRSKIRLG